jgi:hypothetical protein
MTKILAVKYPTSTDRVRNDTDHLHSVCEVEDSEVKIKLGELLFNSNSLFRYNYCLIKYSQRLFVIEATDYDKNIYSRKEVTYHPLAHMLV